MRWGVRLPLPAAPQVHDNNQQEVNDVQASDLLFLNSMVTPKVMTFIYWLGLVCSVIFGLVTMFTYNFFAGLIAIPLSALWVRLWCELIIVLFRINEALQDIRAK